MDPKSRKTNRPKSRQSLAHPPVNSNLRSEKDNVTTDIAALQRKEVTSQNISSKRLRGKSLGPGVLEALNESSGNAIKAAAAASIKSILKPTVPLTPSKTIPSFDELQKRSDGRAKSTLRPANDDLLIDFSTPGPSIGHGDTVKVSDTEAVADPFSPIAKKSSPNKLNVDDKPTKSEQNQEAELRRHAEKQAILDRRAARRKSMANRRVSFAPEATLHTWSVMELAEDSTTSSASNSTRRQSSLTASRSPMKNMTSPNLGFLEPSTPPEKSEELQVKASPAVQHDMHQTKRRRSSSNNENEVFSSSPSEDVAAESSPIHVEDGVESDSEDDGDIDGDTAMSIDDGTSHSVVTESPGSSTGSSLDERLRRAAHQAGTRGIQYDEYGEDVENKNVADSNIVEETQQDPKNDQSEEALEDQENLNLFTLPTYQQTSIHDAEREDSTDQEDSQDISMDVTKAVGGIVRKGSPQKDRRKSIASRRKSVARRRSSADASYLDDETMDFTTVGGGILSNFVDKMQRGMEMSDEDMSMEMTNVIGGFVEQPINDESTQIIGEEGNETMDMTAAVGGILAPIEEQTEPQTDAEDGQTIAMEMTRAVGSIIPAQSKDLQQRSKSPDQLSNRDSLTKSLAEQGPHEKVLTPTRSLQFQRPVTSIASETGSPDYALKPRLSGRRQSAAVSSTTPKTTPKQGRIVTSGLRSQQMTPTKQLTPAPLRGLTPNKTPLIANVTQRTASPRKLFTSELKARNSPASVVKDSTLNRNLLFSRNDDTGVHTPSIVLAPKPRPHLRRKSSGVGIDKEGFGSPRVSEILDRRASIGDAAAQFKIDASGPRRVSFQDPREITEEIETERMEEHRRESGRFVMETEANEQQDENATLQLKGMIESMTPMKDKSSKLKGRKSLAVGAARGILGKRPAELDMDDDEGGDSTPKRLKAVSREASPVKQIHLPQPPTKEETTGRFTRADQKRLEFLKQGVSTTPVNCQSPTRRGSAKSPQAVGRFKAISNEDQPERPTSFEDKLDNVIGAVDITTAKLEHGEPKDDEKISLQSFLNMTNIHFIELSTTKRRHTLAQNLPNRPSQEGVDNGSSIETCFAAAATTLPLLELYQHATRELKSYISSGRKIVRSIEAETLQEQPPLFREYVDARPDVRVIMDNQFRNGKAHARLQSKEGWYTWRAQLVEGLKNGLLGIKSGMTNDVNNLDKQQQVLDNVVPQLTQDIEQLQQELESLKRTLDELANVDRDAIESSRKQLQDVDKEYAERLILLEELQAQLEEKNEILDAAAEVKTEMQDQIDEADRVREEYKGWTTSDVRTLKAQVNNLQDQTHWKLVSAEDDEDEASAIGVGLTMEYKEHLRLFFHPTLFQASTSTSRRRSGRKSKSVSGPTAPISLQICDTSDDKAQIKGYVNTEKRFFLQLIRSQLQSYAMMPKGSISSKQVLETVTRGWDLTEQVTEELRLLEIAGLTTTSIRSDERLGARTMLIFPNQSRVDIDIILSVSMLGNGEISTNTTVSAYGMYGPIGDLLTGTRAKKVQTALSKEIESKPVGTGSWLNAIHAFQHWVQTQSSVPVNKEIKSTNPISNPLPLPPTSATSIPTATGTKRSPLAPKKVNGNNNNNTVTMVQKKAIPIPKQRIEKMNNVHPITYNEKENISPVKTIQPHTPLNHEKLLESRKPAMPPEMQEAMMHTPIKRIGALRRSPV